MKKKLKISSAFSGVVATGSYENARPAFSAEQEFEVDCQTEEEINYVIEEVQSQLHVICYEKFKAVEQQMIAERIQKERKDIRFYEKDGVKYPSVTSIINFDSDFFCSETELQQYASQSNITHARVAEFIKSGKWVEPKELSECWTDIVICTKGDLQLDIDAGDFPAFLKKYPMKEMKNFDDPVFNEEFLFAGTPDFQALVDEIPTLADVKRTIDKIKLFMQTAAYSKCKGLENIKQLMGIELNNKTQQGFSKPVIEIRIDNYFSMFLQKRKSFKERYGI